LGERVGKERDKNQSLPLPLFFFLLSSIKTLPSSHTPLPIKPLTKLTKEPPSSRQEVSETPSFLARKHKNVMNNLGISKCLALVFEAQS
jgi:hypothetical protein